MTHLIRLSAMAGTTLRMNTSASAWSMVLFCLAVMISVELFQHGNALFGSFFLLEQIHKLRHGGKHEGADHTAHLGGYH